MKAFIILLATCSVASATERAVSSLSPPLSVEGARTALAQAGVRVGSVFNIGPYSYRVDVAAPRERGANRFTIDVDITSLPLGGQ